MTRANAPTMHRSAELSGCGRYRWLLSRAWDNALPIAVFVMLNPSTADAEQDDPTIRRCIGFARRGGCGEIVVINRYTWRATSPRDLLDAHRRGVDVAGEWRDSGYLYARLAVAMFGGPFIAAWGAHPLAAEPLPASWPDPPGGWKCLGVTKSGAPRHPLYVRADEPLVPWVSP